MDAFTSNPGMAAPHGDHAALTIAALRAELGLTQQEFGERIGLPNKTSISLLESGKRPDCSAKVAVAIEELSAIDGVPRIDAARLSDDVRLSREGLGALHPMGVTTEGAQDRG